MLIAATAKGNEKEIREAMAKFKEAEVPDPQNLYGKAQRKLDIKEARKRKFRLEGFWLISYA